MLAGIEPLFTFNTDDEDEDDEDEDDRGEEPLRQRARARNLNARRIVRPVAPVPRNARSQVIDLTRDDSPRL